MTTEAELHSTTAPDRDMPHANTTTKVCTTHRTGSLGKQTQQGVTLLELMVGVAIGLLVVAVATAALMTSRGLTGTVSDATGIQQQAAYALRVIGQQMRQAGSIYLNLNPGSLPGGDPTLAAVAFEFKADAVGGGNAFDLKDTTHIISGTGTSLAPGYQRYRDAVFTNASTQSLSRNCVGAPGGTSTDQRIENTFQLTGHELRCGGNGAAAQAVIQNVANFQVRYLIQDNSALGDSKVRYSATAPSDMGTVQAVEVCLVLYGSEPMDIPAGSTYTDCDGTSVAFSSLAGARNNRMHLLFREVYQLRSQGLLGSVL